MIYEKLSREIIGVAMASADTVLRRKAHSGPIFPIRQIRGSVV